MTLSVKAQRAKVNLAPLLRLLSAMHRTAPWPQENTPTTWARVLNVLHIIMIRQVEARDSPRTSLAACSRLELFSKEMGDLELAERADEYRMESPERYVSSREA